MFEEVTEETTFLDFLELRVWGLLCWISGLEIWNNEDSGVFFCVVEMNI